VTPASIARVTNSMLSSRIAHSWSSIFSINAALSPSKRACAPPLACSTMRMRIAPIFSSLACKLWCSGRLAALGPEIRRPCLAIS
jgi:hypothetical protein